MAAKHEEMSLLGHLEELRWRVVKSLLAIGAFAIPCGIYWQKIFDAAMLYPLRMSDPKPHLIFTAPAEAVMLSLKIALAGGLICASPVVFYQLWAFIAPGLYKKEKTVILPAVVGSTICFALGVGFSYAVLPFMIKFFASYGAGSVEPYFKASDYMSFIIKIVLAFGLVFEMPVLAFILTRFGLITPRLLVDKMRYAIVALAIVAAILTPPDVVSQLILAAPLLLLYGVSIGVSYLAQEKK